ncbi:2OG-Fe(II) oxygenase family oxidoreductase [Reticulomyxa filosa]|uniref:2OG-Fe(II) oxygenase family oxidoreductase n=1 Tax=Reticulomyxa filosa TaxID=46433 RepID=X6NRL9_RETFI|nr:2OG-Fe(II) oxygenase family oxidoreductase [Reticulomyxa filosa]|eukprot:ETO28588.1 2OG-Fe(II) oxygenase family oxidoreductase [Reticulomyxa filosa]
MLTWVNLLLCSVVAVVLGTKNAEEEIFSLAVINYGHLKSAVPSIREFEEKKLLHALETIGFFVLTNHDVSKEIMDKAWNKTREFFDTSKENKMAVPMTKEYMYGYSADEILSRSETKNGYGLGSDQKETFQVFIGGPSTNRAKDVRWPVQPTDMQEAWTNYYRYFFFFLFFFASILPPPFFFFNYTKRACEKVIAGVLQSVARLLKLPDTWFEDKINDHMSALRALNYPQQDQPPPENSIRCSPHSDYGTFTLLRQDDMGGLQVDKKGIDLTK